MTKKPYLYTNEKTFLPYWITEISNDIKAGFYQYWENDLADIRTVEFRTIPKDIWKSTKDLSNLSKVKLFEVFLHKENKKYPKYTNLFIIYKMNSEGKLLVRTKRVFNLYTMSYDELNAYIKVLLSE